MHREPNAADSKLLSDLGDFRILTVSQIAAISDGSVRVVRRRVAAMEAAGLIHTSPVGFGRGRGRPERAVSLAPAGMDLLKKEAVPYRETPKDRLGPIEPRLLGHQLLVNWFRISLGRIHRTHPTMAVEFLAPTSPLSPRSEDGQPIVCDSAPAATTLGKSIDFTPDGVFSITDRTQQKTLLFFLEVDMGTETVASPSAKGGDFQHKLVTYQSYFRSGRYKRYEKVWHCGLHGFRLLLVTATQDRLRSLCHLVQQKSPSDFVWLTNQDPLLDLGLAAPIWARGGRLNMPPQSILGKMAIPVAQPGK